MKKVLSFILLLVVICFFGCGSSNDIEMKNNDIEINNSESVLVVDSNINKLTHDVSITKDNFFEFFTIEDRWLTYENPTYISSQTKLVTYTVVWSATFSPVIKDFLYFSYSSIKIPIKIKWIYQNKDGVDVQKYLIITKDLAFDYRGNCNLDIKFEKTLPVENGKIQNISSLCDEAPFPFMYYQYSGGRYSKSITRSFEIDLKKAELNDFKATYIHAGTSGDKSLTYSTYTIDKYNFIKYFRLNSTKNNTNNNYTYTIKPIDSKENYDYDISITMQDGKEYRLDRSGNLEIESETEITWDIRDIFGTINVYPIRII